jgi:hypothetical protein
VSAVKWYDPRLGKVLALRDHATRLIHLRNLQRARGQHAKAHATGRALREVRGRLFTFAHERGPRGRWRPGFSPVQRTAYRALLTTSGLRGWWD